MSALGRWSPLAVEEAAAAFDGAPFRWWISGGRALALHLGRGWREHEDTDVGVVRADLDAIRHHLAGWDLHVAAAGLLRPWHGERLEEDRHENNVWVRRDPGGPWELDVTVGSGSASTWRYRRGPSIEVRWADAILRSPDGVPYLAPELQLLFESRSPRTKDDVDAAEVLPALEPARRAWLAAHLPVDHPWQQLSR